MKSKVISHDNHLTLAGNRPTSDSGKGVLLSAVCRVSELSRLLSVIITMVVIINFFLQDFLEIASPNAWSQLQLFKFIVQLWKSFCQPVKLTLIIVCQFLSSFLELCVISTIVSFFLAEVL